MTTATPPIAAQNGTASAQLPCGEESLQQRLQACTGPVTLSQGKLQHHGTLMHRKQAQCKRCGSADATADCNKLMHDCDSGRTVRAYVAH